MNKTSIEKFRPSMKSLSAEDYEDRWTVPSDTKFKIGDSICDASIVMALRRLSGGRYEAFLEAGYGGDDQPTHVVIPEKEGAPIMEHFQLAQEWKREKTR